MTSSLLLVLGFVVGAAACTPMAPPVRPDDLHQPITEALSRQPLTDIARDRRAPCPDGCEACVRRQSTTSPLTEAGALSAGCDAAELVISRTALGHRLLPDAYEVVLATPAVETIEVVEEHLEVDKWRPPYADLRITTRWVLTPQGLALSEAAGCATAPDSAFCARLAARAAQIIRARWSKQRGWHLPAAIGGAHGGGLIWR